MTSSKAESIYIQGRIEKKTKDLERNKIVKVMTVLSAGAVLITKIAAAWAGESLGPNAVRRLIACFEFAVTVDTSRRGS